jgi:hypothetical protein
VFCGKAHGARLLTGANPDGAGASNERERIVADEVGGAFEGEGDGVVGIGANCAELIGNAQDDARGVGTIGAERVVVSKQSKFAVDAASGERFGDDLFSLHESVDAQIAPSGAVAVHVEDERGIFEVREFFAVGIGFGEEFPGIFVVAAGTRVQLEVIAVGADDGFGESDGLIAARPVEGRLEYDFFGWIALRFVETAGGLELAKDVGDAVVADAIAGSEVWMRA